MPHRVPMRAAAAVVLGSITLASCAREPEIDAVRLANLRSVQIDARISEGTSVRSNATPRAQRAGSNAAGGAAAGAGVWFSDPWLIAVAITAPVVVVATGAAGGVMGGAYGAATGSSASPEQIDRAIGVLSNSFRPSQYREKLETELANAFSNRLNTATNTCVEARQERGRCRRDTPNGNLHVSVRFQLDQALTDGAAGGLDIVSGIIVWADPRGLVEPNCISWIYRTRAGNLMDLAQGGGAPLQNRMAQVLPQMAHDLTYLLLPRNGTIPAPAPTAPEGSDISPRRLNPVEFRMMGQTQRGRRAIEQGFYVLDEEASLTQPRRLNATEFRMMNQTQRGRRAIERGFYVLDEGAAASDTPPTRRESRTNEASHSGKWTRRACSYAALSGLSSR